MQKTKLGISAGLLAAVIYFAGLYSGYMIVILLVGYVLLCEENEWLRRSAVKALLIMVLFSTLMLIAGIVPNFISSIHYLVAMFGGSFHIDFISNLANAITSSLGILEKILSLILALKALHQSTIPIPVIDGFVEKYINR